MKKFLLLTGVQLRALLSSLHVGRLNRRRAASGWAAVILLGALCLYISGAYCFAMAGQLAELGRLELLLLLMGASSVLAGLVFTAFAAQGVVFGGRDADLLLSMPVPAVTVLLSKLTALYAENLVFCIFLLLPAGCAWLWYGGGGGVVFVLRLAVGVVFLALLPTVLALAAGFALSWLGSRFANRKGFNLLLYGLLLAGVIVLCLRVNLGVSALAAGAMGAQPRPSAWSLPFQLFQRGVCGNWETLAMFCLLSLVPVLGAAAILSRSYQRLLTGLRSHSRRPDYQLTGLRGGGRRQALLKKEAARYFGTPIYLFNTGIGLILLVVAGAAAAVMGGRLQDLLTQAGLPAGELPLLSLAAAWIGFLLSTVGITASSISLEGQRLWILKEAPVSPREIFAAKVGFQLLLTCPCLAVGAVGLAWGLGLTAAEGAALLGLGALFSCFTALLGLTVNLLLPKLDAVDDMVVVKMSAAAAVSMFGSVAAALACAALVWLGQSALGEGVCLALCALALLAGIGALVWWLRGQGTARFQTL